MKKLAPLIFSIFFAFTILSAKTKKIKKEKETILKEEIVVTADYSKEIATDVQGDFSVLNKDFIENIGEPTLNAILNFLSETNVYTSGTYGQFSSVIVRGVSSSQTVFTINGVKLNDYSTLSFDPSIINPLLFSKIETVYGAQSSVFSSDAMGGVVNLLTEALQKNRLILSSGSNNTLNTVFKGGFNINKQISSTFGFSYFKTDGEFENSDFKQKNAFFSFDLNKNRFESAPFFFYGSSEVGIPFNYGLPSPERRANSEIKLFLLPFNLNFGKVLSKTSISYVERMYRLNDPDDLFINYYESSGKTFNLKSINTIGELDTPLSFGFELSHSIAEEKNNSYYTFKDKVFDSYSFFIEKKEKWKRFKLLASLRGDKYKEFPLNISKKISLLFELFKNRYLFSNAYTLYSEGFRIPKAVELYSPWGNSELLPEKSKNYEMGIRLFFKGLSLKGNLFKMDFNDLIVFDYSSYRLSNIGKAEVKGFNLTSNYSKKFLNASLSYTYIHSQDKNSGLELLRRPKHTLKAIVGLTFSRISAFIYGIYVGERLDYDEKNFKLLYNEPFSLVNLSVNYNLLNNFYIFLKVNNIFDREYCEIYGYKSPSRMILIGLNFKI